MVVTTVLAKKKELPKFQLGRSLAFANGEIPWSLTATTRTINFSRSASSIHGCCARNSSRAFRSVENTRRSYGPSIVEKMAAPTAKKNTYTITSTRRRKLPRCIADSKDVFGTVSTAMFPRIRAITYTSKRLKNISIASCGLNAEAAPRFAFI